MHWPFPWIENRAAQDERDMYASLVVKQPAVRRRTALSAGNAEFQLGPLVGVSESSRSQVGVKSESDQGVVLVFTKFLIHYSSYMYTATLVYLTNGTHMFYSAPARKR